MDLTTRCPQCGTVFTATLEQLQLRKGYIRCISCAHIFDGYDAVVPGGEASAAVAPAVKHAATPGVAAPPMAAPPIAAPPVAVPIAPAPVAATSMPSVLRQRQGKKEPVFATGSTPEPEVRRKQPPETVQPAFSISTSRQISHDSSLQDPVFRVSETGGAGADPIVVRGGRPEPVLGRERDIIVPPGPRITTLREDAPRDSGMHETVPKIYVEPRAAAATDDHGHVSDLPGPEAPRYRSIASVFWGVLIVAGLVFLLAQLAYVYRAQVAHQIPALRPLLTEACAQLKCEVPYSRKISLISIMSSSLRASASPAAAPAADAATAGTAAKPAAGAAAAAADSMTLQVTLRNTYDKPQEWPTLVLDLTDFSGTLIVRKNLPPSSYLTPQALQQPFAGSSEITIGVPIVLNGLKVNGYQLGKFFP